VRRSFKGQPYTPALDRKNRDTDVVTDTNSFLNFSTETKHRNLHVVPALDLVPHADDWFPFNTSAVVANSIAR
jgi:hypothetical protein